VHVFLERTIRTGLISSQINAASTRPVGGVKTRHTGAHHDAQSGLKIPRRPPPGGGQRPPIDPTHSEPGLFIAGIMEFQVGFDRKWNGIAIGGPAADPSRPISAQEMMCFNRPLLGVDRAGERSDKR